MSEPTGTQYGGFWVRFLAWLADSAILFLVSAALVVGAAMLTPEQLTPAILAVAILALLYWPVMHASGLQATFGKALAGLKVVQFDGERISILRSLWRELAKIVSAAVLMVGYLMAAVMPRKQGLHDLMAATFVVREGPSRILVALAIALGGFALPVFVGPMVADPAVVSRIASSAEGLVPQHDLVKRVSQHDLVKKISQFDVMKLFSRQDSGEQAVRPATQASKAAQKPRAAPASKAPASKAEASAPKTEAAAPPKLRVPPPRPPSTSVTASSGSRYNDIATAVMYQDVEGVNELIRLGKWVDKPDSRGVTPIMIAAERGDLKVAEALLRGGANPSPAVRVAEKRSDAEMVQLLKRYAGR